VFHLLRLLLVGVYTVFWGTIALVLIPFDRGAGSRPAGVLTCWVARNWIGWILWTFRLEVVTSGLEQVDASKPAVYMNNHQSVWDVCALVKTLPVDFHFVAKRELAYIPFFGWALALTVGVMVDRGNRERSVASLRAAAKRIRNGANVIIFPEGTRGSGKELGAFKSGGFHLAIEAQVPVVPVTISGSHRITPKGSIRVMSRVMRIHYGPPISTEGLVSKDREALKGRVRAAIIEGFDPDYQGETLAAVDPDFRSNSGVSTSEIR
jgi:1-acyl-sn-glycerol-3-phosphate acyltransferase